MHVFPVIDHASHAYSAREGRSIAPHNRTALTFGSTLTCNLGTCEGRSITLHKFDRPSLVCSTGRGTGADAHGA